MVFTNSAEAFSCCIITIIIIFIFIAKVLLGMPVCLFPALRVD